MSEEFQRLTQRIAEAIEKRTIITTPKKTGDYEKGIYNPFFSLIIRDGELLCIWCGNIKKPNKKTDKDGDIEIGRFRNIEQGFDTDPKSERSWDVVTLKVMHSLGLKL